MESSSIEFFMEIASGQTFWEVSENRHISQSSVSKSISRLESELGIKLFSREKRSVSLTPAGAIFYEMLTRIQPIYHEALEKMTQFSALKKVTCMIVPNTDFLDLELRLQSSRFAELYPEISLTLERQPEPDTALHDLMEEKVDFMVCRLLKEMRETCDFTIVYPDILYVVLPKDHPLAGRDSVDFMELYNEHFLIRSTIIQKAVKEICDALGCPMPPNLTAYAVPSSQLRRDHIISRVSFGQGVTLFFKSDLNIFNLNHVCVCPVTGCPEFPITIFRKKGKHFNSYQETAHKFFCDVIFSDAFS